jgi:hypothetical protein
MQHETRQILSDSRLLAAREAHIRRLEALFAGETPTPAFILQGMGGAGRADLYQEPEQWIDEALDDLALHAPRVTDPQVFRPPIIEYGPYGVHFVDRMFGCCVYFHEEQWWADPLDTPVGQLQPPDLATDPTWRLARRAAFAFVESGVTVPFFGLPTIASPLNVLVNLYGERVLAALVEDPAAAAHDLRVITNVQRALHRFYRNLIPARQLQPVAASGRTQPAGYGQICGCTTHLISARTYREFVAHLDDELLSVYPAGGMIHLCGVHTQHIPTWRAMRSLRAVQVNDRAAEDLAMYFAGLRDDQIIYLNPTETMTVGQAMEITGGRRLVIVADVQEPLPIPSASAPI